MRAASSDLQQTLRQLRPVGSLEELGTAACEAARLVRDGIIDRAQGADVLYRMAETPPKILFDFFAPAPSTTTSIAPITANLNI
jgi:hypothetical protein